MTTRTHAEKSVGGPPAHAGRFFGEQDLHLFNEGTHYRMYRKLGAHWVRLDGEEGVAFAVWAPNADSVSVMGDFNGWNKEHQRLTQIEGSGIWHTFVPGLKPGTVYKYHLRSRYNDFAVDKADPFGFRHELPPRTGSVVADLAYEWNDAAWMRARAARADLASPMSIYELHLGSWRRSPGDPQGFLGYRDLARPLAEYVADLGFTHVELLPIMEHPFYGSWGYQTTGYFAPSTRYGSPQDLMYLIDVLHQHGVGVLLDWVPSHFPTDEHGLAYFDGTHLFEHADRRQGHHPDWDSFIFNYGRHEVRAFLLSSALYWLDHYHADGLRVDAVASMLYLDYSRKQGEWVPNRFGGRENLEAVAFLRQLNEVVYKEYPDVQTVAEESTSWPMVSRPLYVGGLGFGYKWDMGWMHDTLEYMAQDPIHRKYHQEKLTFRMMYAWTENFVLPLSHDEVVHGKKSLLDKMSGEDLQRFAGLRTLYAYMYALPGKKLLFMGAEFGQGREWNHDQSLDWHLLEIDKHRGVQSFLRDLNRFYKDEPAFSRRDADPDCFEWIDCKDSENSVFSLIRKGAPGDRTVLGVFNFTPVGRHNYRIGAPHAGVWTERLNSDAEAYGGSGWGNFGAVEAAPVACHGRPYALTLTLPPLGAVYFTCPPPEPVAKTVKSAA